MPSPPPFHSGRYTQSPGCTERRTARVRAAAALETRLSFAVFAAPGVCNNLKRPRLCVGGCQRVRFSCFHNGSVEHSLADVRSRGNEVSNSGPRIELDRLAQANDGVIGPPGVEQELSFHGVDEAGQRIQRLAPVRWPSALRRAVRHSTVGARTSSTCRHCWNRVSARGRNAPQPSPSPTRTSKRGRRGQHAPLPACGRSRGPERRRLSLCSNLDPGIISSETAHTRCACARPT